MLMLHVRFYYQFLMAVFFNCSSITIYAVFTAAFICGAMCCFYVLVFVLHIVEAFMSLCAVGFCYNLS